MQSTDVNMQTYTHTYIQLENYENCLWRHNIIIRIYLVQDINKQIFTHEWKSVFNKIALSLEVQQHYLQLNTYLFKNLRIECVRAEKSESNKLYFQQWWFTSVLIVFWRRSVPTPKPRGGKWVKVWKLWFCCMLSTRN